MPPKRKDKRNHRKPTTKPAATDNISSSSSSSSSAAAAAAIAAAPMSDCKLPEGVMFSILTRLPVKSLQRFKCVCKPWRKLFSTSEFIKKHSDQTSKNPQNHALVIHSIDEEYYHNMSLLNINSTAKEPVNLINPFSVIFRQMDLVGCIHGLVCLGCPPFGQSIILWNPALNLSKAVRLPNRDLRESPEQISLGLGYDEVSDDYKVVRISCLSPTGYSAREMLRSSVEVYSAKSDSWKRVRVDFPFLVTLTRNNVIAGGKPYWTAIICDSVNRRGNFREVLVWYDVRNEVFKYVPTPEFTGHSGTGARFVEWKGCLATLMYSPTKERDDFVDVLVYDEGKGCWERKSTHGPIGLKMERHMQCSKDGVILAETPEGTLFLYDPVTNGIKEFCIAEAMKTSYEAFSYTESLVYLEGMEEVKEQDKDKFCFKMEDCMEDLVIN